MNEPKMQSYRNYNGCFYPLLMEAGNTIPCSSPMRLHPEYNKKEDISETNHPLLSIGIADVLMLRRWGSRKQG